ncbi:hypothetical protein F2Q68_00037740 [Brassica cretica]|nr:hypothetical protein F2Q68_00037740 [Brassica cretica]
MKIRVIHSLFSPVSRKPTTCFSSWRTQWSLLSRGRTVSLRKRFFLLPPKATTEQSGLKFIFPKVVAFAVESSEFRESFGISFKVKWEEKMWIETSCRIAASTRLRRVDERVGSDEQRLLEASMACVEIRSSMMKNLISSNSKLRWMVARLCVRVQGAV